MFVGSYLHRLDYKSRTSIPKKFREKLDKKAILTRGLDGCLFLYPEKEWEDLGQRLEQLPLTGSDARAFSRYIFGGASEVSFDSLGRITIPDYLREYARIKKDVVILGVLNRVEIWSKDNYQKLSKEITSRSEEIAEKLVGSGI